MTEPNVYKKDAMLVAGIGGPGDETGQVWETYMKLVKTRIIENPVKRDVGLEVRVYPGGTGPGRVHIGVDVTDRNVPDEYSILELPASLYAEFEIYPAKSYESSNEAIEQWLYDNAERYRQRMLDGNTYGIEVSDERFKGPSDPESIVGMLVPVEEISS